VDSDAGHDMAPSTQVTAPGRLEKTAGTSAEYEKNAPAARDAKTDAETLGSHWTEEYERIVAMIPGQGVVCPGKGGAKTLVQEQNTLKQNAPALDSFGLPQVTHGCMPKRTHQFPIHQMETNSVSTTMSFEKVDISSEVDALAGEPETVKATTSLKEGRKKVHITQAAA